MNKRIKNILRCYAAGIGIKETASTFHISRNTVRKYVRLFLSSGKSIEQLLSLPNGQLDELFGCTDTRHREPSSKRIELEALLPGYVSRLSRKGMSVRKLFKEYHTEYPDGYQLSSFKRIVSEYRFHIKVVGHVEHYAAEQMYIDFAGDRLEVVDEMTGETKKAEVFVAILPFSHYTYCEAVWSQRKEDLIKACENAIQYFEGVPAAIVPDNLKAAVTRSDRNEPVINDDFAAFAEYYGCVVYPARVRHPKDKALVENAVKLLYRSIYLDIEGMTFSSLEELNTAIHISLLDFNEKVMAGREMSRKEIFLHGEKDYLRPLPVKRYVMKERKLMTVGKNSYVSLFKHHYSVPKEYVGRRMTILYDADTVEIYCGMNLVATHDRCDIPYTYSWKKEHNLPGHYGPYDKDLEELFQRASEIDNIVLNYLQEVERVMQYPPKAFRSCRGIMTLEKKYGRDRLVAACACADQKLQYGYQALREVLELGEDVDFLPDEDGKVQLVTEDIRNGNGRAIKSKLWSPNRVDKLDAPVNAIFWIMKDPTIPPVVKLKGSALASVMGATLATKTSSAERVAAGTDLNALRIVPYANPFRTYPLANDYEKFKKLVEEKNVDCYIINTGDFMGKKVKPADTLGILETIVEEKAEFKPWGPFSDIEIMDWEGFVPDLKDPEYVGQLKARMQDRVNAVEGFATKKDGYDKLPDEALAALKKVVDEANTL